MWKRPWRRILSVLLSALLAVWGILPPGAVHAHVGGGDPAHQHDDCRESAHHGFHGHGMHGHHEHAVEPRASWLADFISHIHWRFLGIEFSMPLTECPDSGDDGPDAMPPVIVRSADEVAPAAQVGPPMGRGLLAARFAPSFDVAQDSAPFPRLRPGTVDFLCDSARFERSGVLLA